MRPLGLGVRSTDTQTTALQTGTTIMGVSREHNLALGVTNNIGLCPKLPGRFGSRLGNIDMIIV